MQKELSIFHKFPINAATKLIDTCSNRTCARIPPLVFASSTSDRRASCLSWYLSGWPNRNGGQTRHTERLMMTLLNAETESEQINAHTDMQKATVTRIEADYTVFKFIEAITSATP